MSGSVDLDDVHHIGRQRPISASVRSHVGTHTSPPQSFAKEQILLLPVRLSTMLVNLLLGHNTRADEPDDVSGALLYCYVLR